MGLNSVPTARLRQPLCQGRYDGMVNRPFRVAFWALAFNLGLSLCLLMSDPVVVRLALAPGRLQGPGLESGEAAPLLVAEATSHTGAATRSAVGASPAATSAIPSAPAYVPAMQTQGHNSAIADTGTGHVSSARIGFETPPLPIREVSADSETGYPWVMHDASRTMFGTGKFEELPPPPELAAELESPGLPRATPTFDQQTATQLAGLGERLDNLHGELVELHTSQVAVERTVTALAALTESAAAVSRRTESPLDLRAVVLQASLTGELRDGALPALHRSGVAGELDIEQGPWPDVSWAVCHCPADVLTAWLQRASPTDRIAQQTIRLSTDSHVALDTVRLLPPRMMQARGSSVFEWAPRPGWGARLELRRASGGSPAIDVEFRPVATSDLMPAASDWRLVTIPEAGTLVVAGRGRESAHGGGAAGDEAPQHEQPVGRSEVIVVLSPRRTSPDDDVPEPARLAPVFEAPELPTLRN